MAATATVPGTPPGPDDRQQLEALVAECIEAVEHGERDPATRICAAWPHLLPHVRRRLSQLAARGLIPPAADPGPPAVGPYRIVRELGSGGMGSVFLAEQLEPVRRQVALKVIKLGMDTREVVARFAAERQALARMNHPNIAQVFDAGATAEGRPYFVMEYVSGEPLNTVCDRRGATTEQRVQLLVTICRAVQHAHDRGFIHRDLKPGNILVAEHEGQLVPKIIDFGIARATTPEDNDLRTRLDQVLGTPEYMSPEQAHSAGLDLDTRTDVYSLGVVLYELLCGQLPFDSARLRRASWPEMERILREELPTPPSLRLSTTAEDAAAARDAARTAVRRRIAGELDWITLRALAKLPEQRYPSALALAEDLERWLREEPVLAAPPSRTYRLRKFVRRHRVAVTAGLLVLLSLVAALGVSVRAAWIAAAARQRETVALDDMRTFYGLARDAIGNMVDVADARLAEVPQADQARRQMLEDAIGFYESMRQRQPRDLELRIDLVEAQSRIGLLQQKLGRPKDAVATLGATAAEVDRLLAEAPDHQRLLVAAVKLQNLLASALFADGKTDAGRAALRSGLDALARANSAAVGVANAGVIEATLLGNLALHSDDAQESIPLFERALAAFSTAAQLEPEEQRLRAVTAARYAEALTKQDRLEEAATVLAATEHWQQDAGAVDSTALRESTALLHQRAAEVLRRLERFAEARQRQRQAIAIFAQIAQEHPDQPSFADQAAAGWHFLAQLELDASEPQLALDAITNCVETRRVLAARHAQDHRLGTRCVRSLLVKANIELMLWQHHGGTRAPAEATLAQAGALADAIYAGCSDDLEVVVVYAAAHSARAAMLARDDRQREAIAEFDALQTTLADRVAQSGNNAELHYLLGHCALNLVKFHYQLGEFTAAVEAGQRGIRHVDRGLELDARHHALIELAPHLGSLVANAQFRSGNTEAAIATLLDLCDRPARGPDARELGALLLAERCTKMDSHPRRHEWLQRAAAALGEALQARGDLTAALARPPQATGFSEPRSRLRDLDLRLLLASVHEELGDATPRALVLDEAIALAESIPVLETSRLRNLHAQAAECALERGDAALAERRIEQLLARVGSSGGANYLAAVLFVRCLDATSDEDAQDRLGRRAVECLELALDNAEVAAGAAHHPDFAPLRHRADYQSLLRR